MTGEANLKNDDEGTSPVLDSLTPAEEVATVFEIAPVEEKTLPPAPKPAPSPPEPEPEQTEWFGKEAFARHLVGVSYPAPRERILALLRGKRALWWRDYPPIPLDELVGLSRSSIFHSESEVLAIADTWLRGKPRGPIFSSHHRG